jgi:hypothetical protein
LFRDASAVPGDDAPPPWRAATPRPPGDDMIAVLLRWGWWRDGTGASTAHCTSALARARDLLFRSKSSPQQLLVRGSQSTLAALGWRPVLWAC